MLNAHSGVEHLFLCGDGEIGLSMRRKTSGVSEREKTIEYRFFEVKSTKQGELAREPAERTKSTMRLD